VSGAAGYDVWRSIVSGGGYERVGTTAEASFADATVRNGTRAFYVVTAVDGGGNGSGRSPEADALPRLVIADARLEGPAEVSQPLSAVDDGTPINALVRVDGSATASPTVGVGPSWAGRPR
jgi:hypothetical protein